MGNRDRYCTRRSGVGSRGRCGRGSCLRGALCSSFAGAKGTTNCYCNASMTLSLTPISRRSKTETVSRHIKCLRAPRDARHTGDTQSRHAHGHAKRTRDTLTGQSQPVRLSSHSHTWPVPPGTPAHGTGWVKPCRSVGLSSHSPPLSRPSRPNTNAPAEKAALSP